VPRRYFGTDGVRVVVGKEITPELVERLAARRLALVRPPAGSSSDATHAHRA
jgi:phosphomannomutase